MREDRLSAYRFRWLGGLLVVVIVLLLWQNLMLRSELRSLHNHVEEAVATAEDASEYARRAWDATELARQKEDAVQATESRVIPLKYKRGPAGPDYDGRPLRTTPH